MATGDFWHEQRIDADTVDLLAERTHRLRVGATESVAPLIPSLESFAYTLVDLLGNAPQPYRIQLGRLAAEVAWLVANAHSDNSNDRQGLRWGMTAARLARSVGDHDLRAHAWLVSVVLIYHYIVQRGPCVCWKRWMSLVCRHMAGLGSRSIEHSRWLGWKPSHDSIVLAGH